VRDAQRGRLQGVGVHHQRSRGHARSWCVHGIDAFETDVPRLAVAAMRETGRK
jgi:hypothetical protein